jgi:Trk-type K+ transport system membrane component
MTFTSFFGFFFKGETSFRNQMIYKDFTGEENIRNVFSTISKIVTLTIGVELAGAAVLFFSLKPGDIAGGLGERAYFALFHSISAFNNAGFQLRADGLYDTVLRWNYPFQLIIAMLIIFGGLGFPISFNLVSYFRQRIRARVRQWVHLEPYRYKPWIINLNTQIVLWTTGILLVFGTVMLYFTEMGESLQAHSGFSKWIVAFFCSVTTRTAGFNNINMAELTHEGIMITLLLMWIGASPGSTGGGIKTTTIAVATLGIFNIARGRKHIEFGKREIGMDSILRAFIIICLSLIMLGISTFAVVMFESDEMPLEEIAFECFSAFSTVGLSLGITPYLTDLSKSTLILTMFVGRVGAFTILLGLLKQANSAKLYNYPVENVTIT